MAIDFFNTYPQNTGAKSEDYPFGSFRNETAPNAEDGTTLEQKWSNDWLAFFSRLLIEASMTPSGDVDTVKVSQYYDALLALIHRERREVSNALDGTRTEVAASEDALRLAYELASAAVEKSGDTMTGDLILQNKLSLRSVGVPANNVGSLFKFENESGTLAIRRGRADGSTSGETRIVMPNKAGTVALEQDMFGAGQQWVDVTSQRVKGIEYTNLLDRVIHVRIESQASNYHMQTYMTVNGLRMPFASDRDDAWMTAIGEIAIPPRGKYTYTGNEQKILGWWEFR